MHKIYKMETGLIINVAAITKGEYERTNDFIVYSKPWDEYLAERHLIDPETVNIDTVAKVLFKSKYELDDNITYLENEASLCLAKALRSLDSVGPQEKSKFQFRIEKYRNMLNLVEKVKLQFIALGRHSLYGSKE